MDPLFIGVMFSLFSKADIPLMIVENSSNKLDDKILIVNEEWENLTGYSYQEVYNKSFLELFSSDYQELILKACLDAVETGDRQTIDVKIFRKNDGLVYKHLSIEVYGQNQQYMILRYTHATERVKKVIESLEKALKNISGDKKTTLLRTECRSPYRILFVLRNADNILGWSADELEKKNLLDIIPDINDEKKDFEDNVINCLAAGDTQWRVEFPIIQKSKEIIALEGRVEFDHENEELFFMVFSDGWESPAMLKRQIKQGQEAFSQIRSAIANPSLSDDLIVQNIRDVLDSSSRLQEKLDDYQNDRIQYNEEKLRKLESNVQELNYKFHELSGRKTDERVLKLLPVLEGEIIPKHQNKQKKVKFFSGLSKKISNLFKAFLNNSIIMKFLLGVLVLFLVKLLNVIAPDQGKQIETFYHEILKILPFVDGEE
jgi:PAS domain S-box-containing protein